MCSSETIQLRWSRIWLALGWCLAIFICYLSLTPKPPLPDTGIMHADKIGHLLAYTCLMGWFGNLYHEHKIRLVHSVLFILMGVALEFLQGMGQDRLFEYADMAANTLGVILGYLITLGTLKNTLFRIERFFSR